MILSSTARRRANVLARSTVSAAVIAALAAASAQAQEAASVAQAQPGAQTQHTEASSPSESTAAETSTPESPSGEVVVTGTRIVRDGYQAPTPVSVLGADELNALNPVNVADAVNTLPAFSNSVTGRSQNGNLSSGSAGVNQLNLRGLGISRTLVLLDGHRVINASGTAGNSAPDVNTFPTALVKRVDVVTGGASAAYGSDALSGVVNFVLDHEFTGLKGQVQAGETKYSDDKNIDAQLTWGVPFAGGRGHLLLSGEYSRNAGISGADGRPWAATPSAVILNPAYGTGAGKSTSVPQYVIAHNTGLAAGMPGGIITSGVLKGTYFGPNGSILNGFNFGTPVGNSLQEGGDYQLSRIDNGIDLDGMIDRTVTYLRTSFDFTDNVTGYVEGQFAGTHTEDTAAPNRRLGNLTISVNNAYLPASLQQQLVAAGQTSFVMGTTNADMGRFLGDYRRNLYRGTAGLDGKFDAFGTNWKWDAYAQHSENNIDSRTYNDGITAQYLQAVDSVRVNGVPTCRANAVTITAPGCVPYNVFGIGVNSPNQLAYVEGYAHGYQVLKQDVAAANLNGEPFQSWAGPVSTAVGVEHRIEAGSGYATPIDLATGWFAGNYHPTDGKYHVTEGYFETVVPLARNLPVAQEIDLNGAVRATDYSTSGYVTTWKIGLTWTPIDDIRFRATRSRDIRAPNLGELFAGGQAGSGLSLNDPFRATNGVPENISNAFGLTKGNPNLKPEIADTTGFGVVMAPRFLPGFQASVDYWNIDIKGSVQAPDAQTIVNGCYEGNQALCQDISRRPLNPGDPFSVGQLFQVITEPENLIGQTARGIDFEASYRVPMSTFVGSWDGTLSLRGMATRVLKLETTDTTGTVYDGNGVVGGWGGGSWAGIVPFAGLQSPKLRGLLTAEYQLKQLTATVLYHYTGPGVYANGFIDCTANCPVSTTLHPTFGNNHIAGQQTIDLTGAYKFENNIEVFATIENLTNRQPPDIGNALTSAYWQDQANSDYERIGRQYRVGFRFNFK
jgi:outer membrane receptor protein involved in Fe transport